MRLGARVYVCVWLCVCERERERGRERERERVCVCMSVHVCARECRHAHMVRMFVCMCVGEGKVESGIVKGTYGYN